MYFVYFKTKPFKQINDHSLMECFHHSLKFYKFLANYTRVLTQHNVAFNPQIGDKILEWTDLIWTIIQVPVDCLF